MNQHNHNWGLGVHCCSLYSRVEVKEEDDEEEEQKEEEEEEEEEDKLHQGKSAVLM